VGSFLRPRRTFLWNGRFSEAAGIEVAVAITRLAKHGASISLFIRFVKNYIRLLFASAGHRAGVLCQIASTGDAWDRFN
jgi:hypothetical protein